jgi:hypothetical protein
MRRSLALLGTLFLGFWLVSVSHYGNVVCWAICVSALAAVALWVFLRYRRSIRVSRYGPELRYAMSIFSSGSRWADLVEILGLAVDAHLRRSRIGQAMRTVAVGRCAERRAVRYIPAIAEMRSTSYGIAVLVRGAPGQSHEIWLRRCGQLQSALRVRQVAVHEPHGGMFELQLRVRDPLLEPIMLPEPFVTDDFKLPLGVDEYGSGVVGDCQNVSGVVVGGVPGGGKTAWLTFSFASMAHKDDVQWLLIDGKQGYDLEALAPRAYRYISGAEAGDLSSVRGALQEVQMLMRERLRNAVQLYGQPNLWTARPSRKHPIVFVVIDECQAYLDSRSFATKEEKVIGGEIDSCVRDLVKRGRSAGIVVVLSTQRPTADSIPTSTRDNCALRICFSVRTRESATAVLGEHGADTTVTPIGARTGVGVSSVDGELVRFRSPYVSDDAIRRYVGTFHQVVVNPFDLLCVALTGLAGEEPVR